MIFDGTFGREKGEINIPTKNESSKDATTRNAEVIRGAVRRNQGAG